MELASIIAKELKISINQTENALSLLNQGGTVPFIARYRKEATGSLDEVKIQEIADRNIYFIELLNRKQTVIKTITKQGMLTDELKLKIENTFDKTELEDLYLPYKPKRRTRATIAKEHGLEPLAERIWKQEDNEGNIIEICSSYINNANNINTSDEAIQGALDIVAEMISEMAELRKHIRELTFNEGYISSTVIQEKKEEKSKFEQYYEFKELVKNIPSHRILAIMRGEKEEFIKYKIEPPTEKILNTISSAVIINNKCIFISDIQRTVEDSYNRLIHPSIETDIKSSIKENADDVAIDVFAKNMRELLLSPPMGGKRMFAIDPGIRTGCKLVVLDEMGRFKANETIFIGMNEDKDTEAKKKLNDLISKFNVKVIAIGNGTAGRETEEFINSWKEEKKLSDLKVVMVDESGASIYSASEIARQEFPKLDLTVRGAISIGRRLIDPLAELVKLNPKSIGVGQYQHDVNQKKLSKKLDDVVTSCVSYVGVNLNTASAALLSYVAGIGPALAKKIIQYREKNGKFRIKTELLQVQRFGSKAFEQSAGFLRIPNTDNPLDDSAIHPERYPIVECIARDLRVDLKQLVGHRNIVSQINPTLYIRGDIGLPTLRDILEELKKPGRDPRKEFSGPKFRHDIKSLSDLKANIVLEGKVTNVSNFGAFVDIGVHQDGLVHISELSNEFVKNPTDIVKVGQQLKVMVLNVDVDRKRISLSVKQVGNPESTDNKDQNKANKFNNQNQGKDNRQSKNNKQKRQNKQDKRSNKQSTGSAKSSDKGLSYRPFEALKKITKK